MILATFKDTVNDILKNGAFYIALGIVIAIVITVTLILVLNHKKK